MNIRKRQRSGKKEIVSISRLGQRRQVVIPKALCERLGLEEGDFVEVTLRGRSAIVKPKRLVDADDILSPEEEKLVRKGERQLKEGKYVLWEDLKKKLKL